jgi:hypothetical protein
MNVELYMQLELLLHNVLKTASCCMIQLLLSRWLWETMFRSQSRDATIAFGILHGLH